MLHWWQVDKERQERRKASLCRLLARKEQRALQQVTAVIIGSTHVLAHFNGRCSVRLPFRIKARAELITTRCCAVVVQQNGMCSLLFRYMLIHGATTEHFMCPGAARFGSTRDVDNET